MREVAGIERFSTPAKLANHVGSACIPVWSGNTEKHQLNRGANRQLHCAVHRIAVTQVADTHPSLVPSSPADESQATPKPAPTASSNATSSTSSQADRTCG